MDSATILRSLIILCLILVHSTPAYSDDDIYDILKDYKLPIGLLPKGVTDYELDRKTGKFSVSLSENCSFSEGKYELKYESTIGGFISKGKLSSLEGVSMKFLDEWTNIVEIHRRGNSIDFTAVVGKASFFVEYFEESPQCGCGMNCSRRPGRKLMENP